MRIRAEDLRTTESNGHFPAPGPNAQPRRRALFTGPLSALLLAALLLFVLASPSAAKDDPFAFGPVLPESFQYVDIERSLQLAVSGLRPGGHILICDFFKKPEKPRGPISGGFKLDRFHAETERAGLTFIKDIDITVQTAPTIDLIADFLQRVGKPGYELALDYGANTRPWLTKLLTRIFRKKLAKLERKYFSSTRNGEAFAEFKTYRMFLLQAALDLPSRKQSRSKRAEAAHSPA